MIAFQSVTVSARAANEKAEASTIAMIATGAHRKSEKRFIGMFLSPGLHYDEMTSLPARRPSAGAVPGR
jgi:hypothetical protein